LSLFKVLADPSRYAIYQEVAGAGEPPSTGEIAERLDLHPNTVRLHLEKMRDAGLLEVFSDRHGAVGRPQHRWSVVSHGPSLGVEPSGFRVLAHLLAEVATEPAGDADRVVAVGRRRGLERSGGTARTGGTGGSGGTGGTGGTERTPEPWLTPESGRPPEPGHAPELERSTGRSAGLLHASERARAACIRAVVEELADLGFDPTLDVPESDQSQDVQNPGVTVGLSFTKCPFRELAVLYPDLVCELHRGLTEGVLAGVVAGRPGVEARVESFSSLVDADPCRVDLTINGHSAVA
jgi:predicted ArsR family transcriptional regulator